MRVPADEGDNPIIAELKAELEREQGKLRALQDIGQALGSTLDLDELVGILLARITRIMDADQATLYLIDEAGAGLWSRFSHGGRAQEIQLAIGQGLPGWVAKTGRALNVKDAYQDVRFDSEWDRRTGYRTTSAMCVPVKNHQGRTVGVLQVLNKRSGYFTLDDEGMLSALAAQVAVSLENSKLFLSVVGKNMELLETKERLEQKVRELDVLFEIAQVAASAARLDELLEGVLARAMHAIGAEAGSILMSDANSGDLRFRCAVGGDPEAVRRLTIASDQGICGWVARSGQPQIVNDVRSDPRHSTEIADQVGYHPRSVLCVPLRLGEGQGALELLNKAHGRSNFTDDDLKLASVIAGHVSNAIDLAQARERRERQERLSTIGQLLSSVVHDLRGPMTVISGYARFLEGEADPTRRGEYGDAILRQVETVNAMTGEILAFARGDTNLLLTKVYLNEYFHELVDHLRHELEGRSVQLELNLEDRGVAWFDPHKIRRAVHNLVRNAVQAISSTAPALPGGASGDTAPALRGGASGDTAPALRGGASGDTAPALRGGASSGHAGGKIVLGVRRDASGALVLSCTDDGPGIPEAIRSRAFESFISHGKPDGTGLGLAIVQKVVQDHGGKIELNSRPGQTVFTITLPEQHRAPRSVAPQPADGGDTQVIVS